MSAEPRWASQKKCHGHLVEHKGVKFSVTKPGCECAGPDVRKSNVKGKR